MPQERVSPSDHRFHLPPSPDASSGLLDGSGGSASFDGDRPWQRFTWTRKARAVSVELDPEGMHNLDADQLDNSRTIEGNDAVARRLTGQFGAAFQTLLAFLVSL